MNDPKMITSNDVDVFFKNLHPITIQITKPTDAVFLALATLTQFSGNDKSIADGLLQTMILVAKNKGAEAAVLECFSEAKKMDIYFPDYTIPFFTEMVAYSVDPKNVAEMKEFLKSKNDNKSV